MAPHEVNDVSTRDLSYHTNAFANAFPNGNANGNANGVTKPPAWLRSRTEMTGSFPAFYNDPSDDFRSSVDAALQQIEGLRHDTADGPSHFGKPTPFWEQTNDLRTDFPEDGCSLEAITSDMVSLYNGANHVGHKNFQYNIVSHPNKAAIIATLVANYASLNYTMGFSGWNTSRAEVEVGNMVAGLVPGWEAGKQGGLFTFGGSGCYLYAMKYAITSVLRDRNPRKNGIQVKGRIITSRHGHFCNNISSDWLGVGMDSVVLVDTQPRTNKMCMIDLERKLRQAHEAGEPVFVVVCTMGTTDSMVFDPVEEVHALIDKYPNPDGFGRPHIYCDTVAGWAFLTFMKYDFATNPLEFSPPVIDLLQRNVNEMSAVRYADSIALDFHKSGYAPVTTSMFVARDGEQFENLLSRAPGHILHHRTAYSPGSYSVEVSRSVAPALAAWATVRYFGLKGFQTMLGSMCEMTMHLRSLVRQELELVCTADIGCGFLTTIRAYPAGYDAKAQWEKEYTVDSEEARADVDRFNKLQKKIGDRLWELCTTGERIDGKQAYLLNYSTNFCSTVYKMPDGEDGPSFYALKVFPINVNMTKQDCVDIVHVIKAVRDEVVAAEQ